jgi:hypothetical protein
VAKVERMIRQLEDLATQKDPAFFLCPHCDCQFTPMSATKNAAR